MSRIQPPGQDYTKERRREAVATVATDALHYAWTRATNPKDSQTVRRSGRDLEDSVLHVARKADKAIDKAKDLFKSR